MNQRIRVKGDFQFHNDVQFFQIQLKLNDDDKDIFILFIRNQQTVIQ